MKLIGIDLYQHLLGSALRSARGEPVVDWYPDLKIANGGMLPVSWIPEEDLRLSLYARLARIAELDGIDAFEDELEDRFGPLPDEANTLLAKARIRIAARAAGVQRIDAGPAAIAFTPRGAMAGDTEKLGLVEKDGRFLLREDTAAVDRIARIQSILDDLAMS